MKKTILLILALVLTLSLAACGSKDTPSGTGNSTDDPLNRPSSSTSTTTPETPTQGNVPDVGSLIGGNGKLSDYDAATRQQMIDEARAEGGDLEFKADGSVVYTDPDGSKVIQNPDGTWVWESENGDQGQMGGDWPDNEFTKLLPKPDFALTAANTSDNEFSVAFTGVTVEQVKAYAEQVKAKGFTVNPDLQDQEVMGIVVYTYNAKNADGYTVEITFAAGTTGMIIRKP
jgi:predicted small secreted protein/predicted lactoylglutathione lyase